jgi:hypothetical protein
MQKSVCVQLKCLSNAHTCRTCLNCSSKLQPLFCCDELDVSLDVDEFEAVEMAKDSLIIK